MIHVFLLAMAAAQEGILQEVQDEGCLPGMQMLQRSLTPQSAQITQKVDFFNFQEMLSDQPPGSFLAAMEPLVFANTLVYNTTRLRQNGMCWYGDIGRCWNMYSNSLTWKWTMAFGNAVLLFQWSLRGLSSTAGIRPFKHIQKPSHHQSSPTPFCVVSR